MRTVLILIAAATALAACTKPSAEGPRISVDSVYACQEAVKARGFPGASFEQVDAQPGREPPVTGTVVMNGQRASFTCSLDGSGQVSGVTVNGQPR